MNSLKNLEMRIARLEKQSILGLFGGKKKGLVQIANAVQKQYYKSGVLLETSSASFKQGMGQAKFIAAGGEGTIRVSLAYPDGVSTLSVDIFSSHGDLYNVAYIRGYDLGDRASASELRDLVFYKANNKEERNKLFNTLRRGR